MSCKKLKSTQNSDNFELYPDMNTSSRLFYAILWVLTFQSGHSQSYRSVSERSGIDLVFLAEHEVPAAKKAGFEAKSLLYLISEAESADRVYKNGKRLMNRATVDFLANAFLPNKKGPGYVRYLFPDSATVTYLLYKNYNDSLPIQSISATQQDSSLTLFVEFPSERKTETWQFLGQRSGWMTRSESNLPVYKMEWMPEGIVSVSKRLKSGKWKTERFGDQE